MIKEKDIKFLEKSNRRVYFWIINIIFSACFIINVVAGFFMLSFALKLANQSDITLLEAFSFWDKIDLGQKYAGLEIKSAQFLFSSIMKFSMAVIFLILLWAENIHICRNKRILNQIKKCEPAGGPYRENAS
jgi:hypothetical protein